MPTNAHAVLFRRLLFAAQLAVIAGGSYWCLLCVGAFRRGSSQSGTDAMVLSPFIAATIAGLVAYALKWSKAFQSSLLLATAVVAALSSAAYNDVALHSGDSAWVAVIYIIFPFWGFVIGAGLVAVTFGPVWVVRHRRELWVVDERG